MLQADFFLDVVSLDHRSPELEESSSLRVRLLTDRFKEGSGSEQAKVGVPTALGAAAGRGAGWLATGQIWRYRAMHMHCKHMHCKHMHCMHGKLATPIWVSTSPPTEPLPPLLPPHLCSRPGWSERTARR